MDYETFRPRRAKIAQQIYETLNANPPEGCTEVHSPDSIGATGLQFEDGYVLVQVESADD